MELRTGPIPRAKTILDVAFKRARDRVTQYKYEIFLKSHERKVKRTETIRIQTAADNLRDQLRAVHDAFPSLNQLAPFYLELVRATIDTIILKQSIAALPWAIKRLSSLQRTTAAQIERSPMKQLHDIRKAFFGRASSIVNQVDGALKFLEDARLTFKRFPAIKTSIPTIVIAGMPNGGKSTLLKALTGAKPDIKPYPFTTQNILLGYRELGCRETGKRADGKAPECKPGKIQFIDTPGLLDRPLDKRNPIERKTILALTHLANAVLFVIDISETGGYTRSQQLDLLRELKKQFDVQFIIVANKADLAPEQKITGAIHISAEDGRGVDDVVNAVEAACAKPTPTEAQE